MLALRKLDLESVNAPSSLRVSAAAMLSTVLVVLLVVGVESDGSLEEIATAVKPSDSCAIQSQAPRP